MCWQKGDADRRSDNRRSKPKGFDIIQINANSWGGHVTWLQCDQNREQVVCGQDHKLVSAELPNALMKHQREGWDISAATAARTDAARDGRNRSAGANVAVRRHGGSVLLWPHGTPDFLEVRGGVMRCHEGMRTASTMATRRQLRRNHCGGRKVSRLPLDALGFAFSGGHVIWRTGGCVWCPQCVRNYTRKTALRNLSDGRAPRANGARARRDLHEESHAKSSDRRVGQPVRMKMAEWIRWRLREVLANLAELDGAQPQSVTDYSGITPSTQVGLPRPHVGGDYMRVCQWHSW